MYELMGLATMIGVGDRADQVRNPNNEEFSKLVKEKGLKEALKFRDAQFDPDISRV